VKDPKGRFHMDACMLSNAMDELGKNLVIPKCVLPFYQGEWFYFVPPQPYFKDGGGRRRIYGISFPGSDDLDDFHPLDYSWLYHEIGHHIIDRLDPKIFQSVAVEMNAILNIQKRQRFSASTSVRKTIDEPPRQLEQWLSSDPLLFRGVG
jgi:hypothetical protein